MAPSYQLEALKYMPWWCSVIGSESELVACRRRVSFALTSIGGGLRECEGERERKTRESCKSRKSAYHKNT